MNPPGEQRVLDETVALSKRAGEAMMAIYSREEIVATVKKDDSPLTLADTAAHRIIVEGLKK